jgi:hypothetical protein
MVKLDRAARRRPAGGAGGHDRESPRAGRRRRRANQGKPRNTAAQIDDGAREA